MKHRISLGKGLALLCSAVCCAAAPVLAEARPDMRIIQHQPLTLVETQQSSQTPQDPDAGVSAQRAGVLSLLIDVMGQQHELELTPNDPLIAQLPADQRHQIGQSVRFYAGTIRDIPESWVRLTRHEDGWSGAMWDGAELYLIDRTDQVWPALDASSAPLSAAQAQTASVIYRLSDVRHDGECGLEPGTSALLNYQFLVDHLSDLALDALPATATKQLQVSVVGDVQFSREHRDPTATLVSRMNVVDGIYSSQVGVEISVVDIRILSDDGPLTSSNASTLLQQFAGYARGSNPGLAHLFTGRDMSGGVVGIAYLGVLCNRSYGVGVSEDYGSFAALVAAHEIGHNFGAPHDNQSGSPCAGTPGLYLMNPWLNGSDELSACSIDQMRPYIAAASCITEIPGGEDPDPCPDCGDPDPGPCADCIDFNVTATKSYAGQDVPSSGSVRVLDGGSTLKLEGNRWRSTTSQTFTVTPSTVLEFDFLSTSEGEIHGIGFDENDRSDDRRVFQISGFQTGARTLTPDTVYTRAGSYQRIRIPVGQYYTGDAMYLVIVNDKDRGRMDNTSYFRNVRIVNEDRRAAVWTGARWSIPAGATVR